MMKLSRLLLDTNVWLDYFLGEGPSLSAITLLVERGFEGSTTLMYAPTSAKDLFYLIPRRLRALDKGEAEATTFLPAAWACIERLMETAIAAPQSLAECELARMMRGTCGDFEDNLILAAAETAKADYVVTSDRRLLASAPEACITPERAVALLSLARP